MPTNLGGWLPWERGALGVGLSCGPPPTVGMENGFHVGWGRGSCCVLVVTAGKNFDMDCHGKIHPLSIFLFSST